MLTPEEILTLEMLYPTFLSGNAKHISTHKNDDGRDYFVSYEINSTSDRHYLPLFENRILVSFNQFDVPEFAWFRHTHYNNIRIKDVFKPRESTGTAVLLRSERNALIV